VTASAEDAAIHATALLIGEAGLLLRGAPGSGKSLLALDLIMRGHAGGGFAALIADDRTLLSARNGRLIARPHPAIAAQIELRGSGVVHIDPARAFEPAGVIRLVVDLLAREEIDHDRCPEPREREAVLCGLRLPRLRLSADAPAAAGVILSNIHHFVLF
jgi:HPr kinase/phosphorylase